MLKMKIQTCAMLVFLAGFDLCAGFSQTVAGRTDDAAMLRSSISNAGEFDMTGSAVKFEFKYKEGDNSRILSRVNEDVFVNRRLDHHAEILNRIAMSVDSVNPDGSAVQSGTFMTSENSIGRGMGASFTWGEEYKSVFTRSKSGVYTIGDEYFMPTVRDVPVFPDREVKPGESWTAQGHEAHDLRRQFGIAKPFKVPFNAFYTYLGTVKNTSKAVNDNTVADEFSVINVKYTMYMETPMPSMGFAYTDYPVRMTGYSDELIYWDSVRGTIDHYTENFRIVMETSYGNVFEFRGTSSAEVTEFERTATEEKVAEIQEIVNGLGIDDVTVKKSEKGLTLSIENIQFFAESAELMNVEKNKLNQIAKILQSYPDHDILVTGHTAHFPGGQDPQVLSEERAKSVADYLIQLGVRDQYHIFTQGMGDRQPIDSNNTQTGRAKNRRVEITIMDN